MAESISRMADPTHQSVGVATRREAQRFFFRVPNILFELGLSPYELSLYLCNSKDNGRRWRHLFSKWGNTC